MLTQTLEKFKSQEDLRLKLLTATVIILAIMVRLYGLGFESAWIDEAYSINLSKHSIPQIIQGTAADQHPPLYYVLLHFWQLIGTGVTHARLLSALIGTFFVFQAMTIGLKISGEHLGIGTGLLLAISPLAVWYSQEARQYMLLATLTTAATFVLWQCMHGRKRWVLYWLFSALALYTQYFAVFILFAHAVLLVIWIVRQNNKRLILPWLISIAGVGLVFLPWVSIAVNQFFYHTMPWITDPSAGQIRDVILTLLLGNGIQILPQIFKAGLFILFIALLGWSAYRIKDISTQPRDSFLFLLIWAIIPILAISILSIFYQVFQLKQFLIILMPVLMVAVYITLVLKQTWGRILFIGLIIINGGTLLYQQATLTKDDWRGVATYIEDNISSRDLVYANPAASSLALNLYLESNLPYEGYPTDYDILTGGWNGVPITPEEVERQFASIKGKYQRIWLVEFFPEFWDIDKHIESWLEGQGQEVGDRSFGKIRLRLFSLNP